MRWLTFLFIFGIISTGIYFISQKKELAQEPSVTVKPIVSLTEINQNFLDQVNKCFIPAAAVYGYTLRVTSGFRSLSEQEQIYNQGRMVDGRIVSWAEAGKSMHNYGYAVDVVDRWHGYNIDWKKLADIGSFCGLTQVDDAHFEYRGGLTTAQFEAGILPPPISLSCPIMAEKAKLNQPLTIADLKSCGA